LDKVWIGFVCRFGIKLAGWLGLYMLSFTVELNRQYRVFIL